MLADEAEEGEGRLERRRVRAVLRGKQAEGLSVEFGDEDVKSGDPLGLAGSVRPELDVHVVDVVVVLLVSVIAKSLHDLPEAFFGPEDLLQVDALDVVDPLL